MRIFAGFYKNRMIQAPKGIQTRPTSGRLREALFNICQGMSEEGMFLDLFAGSGAMGLEALSRGAKAAVFVDKSKDSIRCIQSNVQLLKVESQSQIICGDVLDVLGKLAKRGVIFDIIYADPPYEKAFSEQVLQLIDKNISLIAPGGSLFLEDSLEALPQIDKLEHLVLKSTRRMGRAGLQHYLRHK